MAKRKKPQEPQHGGPGVGYTDFDKLEAGLNALPALFEARAAEKRRLDAEAIVAAMQKAGAAVPVKSAQFLGDPLQVEIWHALDGRALNKQQLADEVAGSEGSRLYKGKAGGIKAMMDTGHVAHKQGWGYYRPDSPPPEMKIGD